MSAPRTRTAVPAPSTPYTYDGWYVGHEDECYDTGDCGCSGVQVQCECVAESA